MKDVYANQTFNIGLIRDVMLHPELWATVAEDGQDPDAWIPDLQRDCWLRINVENTVIGLFSLSPRNLVSLEIHAQILPEYRKLYSVPAGRAALAWIHVYAPECEKVICYVPVIYPNVRDYAQGFGFKPEGVNRLSYAKGGQLHDQWLLGLTRDELEDFLNE